MITFKRTVAVVVVTLQMVLWLPALSFADPTVSCQQYTVPVNLSAVDPTVYHIAGWYCTGPNTSPSTIQLLVSGSTYGHVYWDFPYQQQQYSYVQNMVQSGYAVFTIDRLGIGLSDHPLDTLVTTDAHAYILHQIIQRLHDGTLTQVQYPNVIVVGHSYGSMITIAESSQYHDEQGVILTGFLHNQNPNSGTSSANYYPASLDPRFSGSNLSPGYLTTMPGTRGSLFYYLPNADPAVIATDEATKETLTTSELATGAPVITSNESQQISVPVLNVVGEYDNVFCGGAVDCTNTSSVLSNEAPYYSPQANYTLEIIPDAGHVLNLQLNAQTPYTLISHWMNQTYGS